MMFYMFFKLKHLQILYKFKLKEKDTKIYEKLLGTIILDAPNANEKLQII